jgi:hypothetical protein
MMVFAGSGVQLLVGTQPAGVPGEECAAALSSEGRYCFDDPQRPVVEGVEHLYSPPYVGIPWAFRWQHHFLR